MIPDNLTYVTFYRARLDPLDLYRLDDIFNHDGPPCFDTPVAALATHFREISPETDWGTDITDYCEEVGLESESTVIMAAKFKARTGPCTVFVNLVSAYGSMDRVRRVSFSTEVDKRTNASLQACSMGSAWQKPESTGVVDLGSMKSKCSPDVAYELAIREKPLVIPTSILFKNFGEWQCDSDATLDCSPDATAEKVEGFTQVSWLSAPWAASPPPAPGVDATYDFARATEEDNPAAIMSSIVQGDGYPPQVNLVSPED